MCWRVLREEKKYKFVTGDGSCLFRCISEAYFGTPHRHGTIRAMVVEALILNQGVFTDRTTPLGAAVFDPAFIRNLPGSKGDTYQAYVNLMSKPNEYGDTGCLVAFAYAYPQFQFAVWSKLSDHTSFTDNHDQMDRYGCVLLHGINNINTNHYVYCLVVT